MDLPLQVNSSELQVLTLNYITCFDIITPSFFQFSIVMIFILQMHVLLQVNRLEREVIRIEHA